jgi:hypothetical protein
MMQTADLGEGNNVARGGKLHATRPWAVLVEREMRSGVMMILKIARQYAAQVTLVVLFNILGILRSVCDGDPSAAKSVGSIASQ